MQMVYYSDILDNLEVNPLTCQLALATNGVDVMNSLARLILMGEFDREYEDIGGNIGKMLFEPVELPHRRDDPTTMYSVMQAGTTGDHFLGHRDSI